MAALRWRRPHTVTELRVTARKTTQDTQDHNGYDNGYDKYAARLLSTAKVMAVDLDRTRKPVLATPETRFTSYDYFLRRGWLRFPLAPLLASCQIRSR